MSNGGGFPDLDLSVPICPLLSFWAFPDFGDSKNVTEEKHININKFAHININKFAGLSRDWLGVKILLCVFFRFIWGRKTYVFFSLCVFFAPKNGDASRKPRGGLQQIEGGSDLHLSVGLRLRDGETTIQNKICVFEGGGHGGREKKQ